MADFAAQDFCVQTAFHLEVSGVFRIIINSVRSVPTGHDSQPPQSQPGLRYLRSPSWLALLLTCSSATSLGRKARPRGDAADLNLIRTRRRDGNRFGVAVHLGQGWQNGMDLPDRSDAAQQKRARHSTCSSPSKCSGCIFAGAGSLPSTLPLQLRYVLQTPPRMS